MRLSRTFPILAAVFLLFASWQAHAQDPQPESSSKPATPPDDMKPKSKGRQKKDSATQNAPDQPAWDPLRAQKHLSLVCFSIKNGTLHAPTHRLQHPPTPTPAHSLPFPFFSHTQHT